MSRRTTRVVFAVLAVAFFAAPVALRAAGVTAEEFENRRLAAAPKPSQGWSAFDQATRFVVDRMPLRADAVRLNTRIWTDVFGTDPRYGRDARLAADKALPFAGAVETGRRRRRPADARGEVSAKEGDAGWLYGSGEFEYLCNPALHLPSDRQTLDRWADLVQEVRATGRRSAMFVVPQKASVYPEHLPDEYPFDDCALDAKERLWSLLARDGPALGVREVRSELLRRKPEAGDDGLFQRVDTHWTTRGALVMVDAVLDVFGGGVRMKPSEIVARGAAKSDGDLAAVSGRRTQSANREYAVVRPRAAPRVPGRTLLICDSYVYKWMRLFKPYFEHVTYYSLYGMISGTPNLVSALRQADTVVLQAEEYNFKALADDGSNVMSVIKYLRGYGL